MPQRKRPGGTFLRGVFAFRDRLRRLRPARRQIGRSADRRGRRSRRQILHRRQAVRGGSDGGGVSARRADGRQVGGQLRQSAGRQAIRQRRQSGRRRRYQTRRPAQRYHAAQARRRSIARAIRQPHRPAGRRRYQTPAPAKIPRRAGPREILNAPARGTGGAAVVLCGFGSAKFF